MTTGSSPTRPTLRRLVSSGIALLVVLGVVFAGCSSGDGDTSTTTSADVGTTSLDDVTVAGAFGEKPTIEFTPAFAAEKDTSRVISTGDGAAVEDGQRVTVDFIGINGSDASELDSTFGATPQVFGMGSEALLPIITEALVGQTVGSRVLVATDASATAGAWVLMVIDIKDAVTIPTSASGTPVTPPSDLPAVTVENDVPTVANPEGDPPTELVVQPLIQGSGPVVTSGQTLTLQYVGLIWGSGEVFDTSWDSGPVDFAIGSGQVIAGFDNGLVGQNVGSRVMLVIPPDQGYGAEGNSQAGISGTDTLIFVVDILAAS